MRSLAADNLVNHYRDFGGGIEVEADPRRRTEALCEQERQHVAPRLPLLFIAARSSGLTASFTFGTVLYFLMDRASNSAERRLCLHWGHAYRKSPLQFVPSTHPFRLETADGLLYYDLPRPSFL